MKKLIILLILLIPFLINTSKAQSCDTSIKYFDLNKNIGSNNGTTKVKFVNKKDNYPSVGKQIWYYEIKSGTQYAISHIMFNYAYCVNVIQAGEWNTLDTISFHNKFLPNFEIDPATNTIGYKFDKGFNDNQIKKYYLIVDKLYQTDSVIMTIKAGVRTASNYLCGPNKMCSLPIDFDEENIPEYKVASNDNVNKLLIFPNPTHNILNIPNKIGMNMIIYDSTGKQVFRGINTINMVTELKQGMYFIYIDDQYIKLFNN